MKYRRGYRSKNTEYRGAARRIPGGRAGAAGAGLGGLGIIGVLIAILFGGGSGGSGFDVQVGQGSAFDAPEIEGPTVLPPRNEFLEFVFDDVQNTWADIFAGAGEQYPIANFVIFTQAVETDGCGLASSAVGPFYCPADARVYLDQAFLEELQQRFGAPGDFAQAYVVAHEVGHHVQNVLGISSDVRALQSQNPGDANELSVRLELQADCLAGVWAYSAEQRGLLDRGDLGEGLDAAAAVGDDRIQASSGAQVNPESWTHGSAEQRMQWFTEGLETGDINACDTFGG